MKKSIVAFLSMLLFTSCVKIYNRNVWISPEINGQLIDSVSNEPIINAKVSIYNGNISTATDSLGKFYFRARSEYVDYRLISMDPPNPGPTIDVSIETFRYENKIIPMKYDGWQDSKNDKPDTLNFGRILLQRIK